MSSRLREKSGLLAVEPFCDGGEFVLERDGLVDRRDDGPVLARCASQSRNVSKPDCGAHGKEEVPFVTASRVFIYVSINVSLCAGNGRARYGMKRSEIAV